MSDLGWWAIPGVDLLEMLRQVADGADPDTVYLEAYANGAQAAKARSHK